jgi:hypothetical protein
MCTNKITYLHAVSRIRIRMNPHGFGLLDPHPESAFKMRIQNADSRCGCGSGINYVEIASADD